MTTTPESQYNSYMAQNGGRVTAYPSHYCTSQSTSSSTTPNYKFNLGYGPTPMGNDYFRNLGSPPRNTNNSSRNVPSFTISVHHPQPTIVIDSSSSRPNYYLGYSPIGFTG